MNIAREFLEKARQGWPRLADADLALCNDEERALVRGMEAHAIQGVFQGLSDLVLNCQNKFQYAKTYKVLRADLRKTFANPNLGNPQMPTHVNQAVRQAFIMAGENQLRYMAEWFYITYADASDREKVMEALNKGQIRLEAAIEQYAGKGDGIGCLGVVVLLGVIFGGPLACCYWVV
jgi:hypothetical protein